MIDFSYDDEQEIFREAIRDWCKKKLTMEKVREWDTKGEIPFEILKDMADMGLLVLTAPEEHDGPGVDWVTACMVAEELGYADISIALPVLWLVEGSWGFAVDRHCSEEVRQKVIHPAIAGDAFIGIGATESGGGSDVAGYKTTAKKDGDNWIINGEKTYISGTEEAKKLGGGYYLLAYNDKSQGHRGMTGFYLPINHEGVEISKRFDDMGRMAVSTGAFNMKNVKLPDSYRIGEVGKGFYITMEGFSLARLLIGSVCVGAAKRALDIGMDYIKERRAFGRAIGKFEGIQFELADWYTELESMRALVEKTAWMTDQMYQKDKYSMLEVGKWIAMTKLKAPHMAFNIYRDVMLWLGAWGYTKECPLEMGMRGIMSYCIGAEGSKNIQRVVIARELLGKEFIPYK